MGTASPPGSGIWNSRAGVGDLAAVHHLPHDLHGLADTGQGAGERYSVQAFHHLGTGRAEAQQEPSAGEVGQGDGRLREGDRGPRADLHHGGAEQHPVGACRVEAQRGGGVGAPGLGHPADVEAELLGLDDEIRLIGPGRTAGRLDRGRGPHHASASFLMCSRTPVMLRSNSRRRTNTIFCSLSGMRVDGEGQPGAAGAHLHPLRQIGPAVLRLQPETPDRAGILRVPHGPGEDTSSVVLDHLRGGFPLPERIVLVAADEPGSEGGPSGSVQPLDRLELIAHGRHQGHIRDQLPHPARWSADPGPYLDRRPVGVARACPFHDGPASSSATWRHGCVTRLSKSMGSTALVAICCGPRSPWPAPTGAGRRSRC